MSKTVLLHRLSVLALVALAVGVAHADTDSSLPRLEVVARYPLTLDGEVPFDVRWAGPDSVYVAFETKGVFEHELREGAPVQRQVFPDAYTLRFDRAPGLWNLAASDDWILVSSIGWHLAWREPPTTDGAGGFGLHTDYAAATYLDLDVDHDRVVLLGKPNSDHFEDHPGAIVWLGRIDGDSIDDWRLVYESDVVAERFRVVYDRGHFKGSVRFLDGGDFVVAPGFTGGVLHFSKTGKLKESWAPEDLWEVDGEEPEWIEGDPGDDQDKRAEAQFGMLRDRHFIDEVLPHPDGPAILVRRPDAAEGSRYRLGILGAEIRWYDLPDLAIERLSALRADVDEDGRLVILGGARSTVKPARFLETELVVLEVPSDH